LRIDECTGDLQQMVDLFTDNVSSKKCLLDKKNADMYGLCLEPVNEHLFCFFLGQIKKAYTSCRRYEFLLNEYYPILNQVV